VSDPQLFAAIKYCLLRSLRTCQLSLRFLTAVGCKIKFHGRARNEPTHYCGQCEVEVFNFLLIKEEEKRHVVHCINCARRIAPRLEGFLCLQEYTMKDLTLTYDNFTLHTASAGTPSLPPPPPSARPFLAPQPPAAYHGHAHSGRSSSNAHHSVS
ncbi:unnamed protein product, partial [Cyprideis torosa]